MAGAILTDLAAIFPSDIPTGFPPPVRGDIPTGLSSELR